MKESDENNKEPESTGRRPLMPRVFDWIDARLLSRQNNAFEKAFESIQTVLNNRHLRQAKTLSLSILVAVIFGFVYFYEIEVVAQGRGITTIKDSDVVIKLPESAYIKSLYVSQSDQVEKGDPLLTYRNLDDEYLLKKTQESLNKDLQLKAEIEQEMCFLYSSRFADAKDTPWSGGQTCDESQQATTAGGLYLEQFYLDYKQEKDFFLQTAQERAKKKTKLLDKLDILFKKKKALSRGGAETLRFYDLQGEIADLNNEIIAHGLLELENEKKLKDKLVAFSLKRAERALTLKQTYDKLETDVIEKSNQVALLSEKKKLSVIYSPISGSVLSMMEGISVDTHVEKGGDLFVLKKQGVSRAVKAKFDARYRSYLHSGSPVKIKITAPGVNHLFNGTIVDVSSDSLEHEKNNPAAGRYYEVSVQPEESFFKAGINLGLEVDVFSISEQATVFDYIMSVFPSYGKLEVW